MHVAPLRRCDSHPCDKSRPATQQLNPWPPVSVHIPTRERTQDARTSTSSMAKPLGRAADDAVRVQKRERSCAARAVALVHCLLYTSDAADERSSVDLGGRRIIKKKKT